MPENQTQTSDTNEVRPEDDAAKPAEARSFDTDRQDGETGQDETDLGEGLVGTTYEPSTVEVNRAREQGLGVGQKDIDHQRDPTGDKSYEEY